MDRDPTAESLLRDGRQAYSARRYKQAAKCFTLALKRCHCNKGIKRERCWCKNFARAAESNSSVFHEALKACECSVGKTFELCDNELHIQALDYRAAAFEALEAIDRARNDAEWMLELAPHSPVGYLRLGKVFRLKNQKRLAWKVFNGGIEAGLSAGLSPAETNMKKLYDARRPLQARYSCLSPLDLPTELVHHIFSFLNFPDLMVCTRVSKQWRVVMTSPINCHLWRTFEWPQPLSARKPLPSARALKKYLSWSRNDVRTVIIRDVIPYADPEAWIKTLIRGAPKLSHFEIRDGSWSHRKGFFLHRVVGAWPKSITKLILRDVDYPGGGELPFPHLSHLELREMGTIQAGCFLNLRHLSICTSLGHFEFQNLPVPNTPNLEQLKIRINTNNGRREVYNSESIDEKEFWPNLKVLIFEGSAGQSTIDFAEARLLQRICTHNNGNGLLHLDISKVGRNDGRGLDFRQLGLTHRLSVDEHANHMRADDWDKAPEPPTAFSDLRALRLDMLTEPEPTQKLLQLSQENGNLREFDINFPILGLGASGGEHLDFLEQFGWLQGVKSIQKLSVRDFHFDLYSDKQTEALPEFLGTFPDLQTLHIESSYHTAIQLSLLIFRIMKSCGELKVVYAPGMAGIALDKLRREGRDSYGVRVVPTPEPKSWPVPI